MEPVSIILASAAAGGIAGKLSEQITGYLWSFFANGHSEATRARAQANIEDFVEVFARRLDARLAQAAPSDPLEIEDRLTDPDMAATLESAARTAARTSDGERHGILANLVAERLVGEGITVDTVVAASAIEVLPKLAPVHVEILGLHMAISYLRPEWWGDESLADLDEHADWMKSIVGLYNLDIEYSEMDLLHLASAGCIRYPNQYPASVEDLLR
ncbi:MAG TPA: LPO_1073/Vpar_1526 family protein, partial [Longimicrobium sp.]|nr:LPO_1073/Vpar_1526 family protein [Longimicrobium sp.]